MAKIDLKFIDLLNNQDYIQVEFIEKKPFEIFKEGAIQIQGYDDGEPFVIVLDKSTAIKFAKTLRTEINKITASEESKTIHS